MHNQFRAQLTGYNRVLYCLLEKQLQMLLTWGGPPASHTRPSSLPRSPWPTLAPAPPPCLTPSWFPGRLLMDQSRRCPHLPSAASAQVAVMASTSSRVSHPLFPPSPLPFRCLRRQTSSLRGTSRSVAFRSVPGSQTGPESLPLGVMSPGAYVAGLGVSRVKA